MSAFANQRFYRTDILGGMEFVWDGTRWASTQLFSDIIKPPLGDTAVSATGGGTYFPVGFPGSYDLWLESCDLSFFVNGGGSALDGSNKWTVALIKRPAGSSVASHIIQSGASGTYRAATATLEALLGITNFAYEVTWTKVGTPGSLLIMGLRINYRLVAT